MSDVNGITELSIAKWSDRFLAWLIDFIIVSIISAILLSAIFGNIHIDWDEDNFVSRATQYFPSSILFFAYWIILEYKAGQSIGKKILHLKTSSLSGKNPDLKGVIISSFGKAFLLPFDVILGVIFTNEKRQRIFNKIGDTIVIKISDSEVNPENIKYRKD